MEQAQLPTHIAIIPDGNRRWARERGKPGFEGHLEGAKRFREISRAAFEMGIRYFSFWGASIGNLEKRSPEEVRLLVSLLKRELADKHTLEMYRKNQIHFWMPGAWDWILRDAKLRELVTNFQNETSGFKERYLTLLFGYSGKWETEEACHDLYQAVLARHENPGWTCSSEPLAQRFSLTGWLSPVDLVIRTGACEEGPNWSHNSSGFMTWLAADAKTFSPPTLWPDFTVEMFRKTVADYSKTPRRFGA